MRTAPEMSRIEPVTLIVIDVPRCTIALSDSASPNLPVLAGKGKRSYELDVKCFLDLKFFEDLLAWKRQGVHDVTCAGLLRKIRLSDGGSVDDVPEFIGIFPARAHLKMLTLLTSLKRSLGKDSAVGLPMYELAETVLRWWDYLMNQLGTSGRKDFTEDTWDIISTIWEMVLELCQWVAESAHGSSLYDGPLRWSNYSEIDTLALRLSSVITDRSRFVICGSKKSLLPRALVTRLRAVNTLMDDIVAQHTKYTGVVAVSAEAPQRLEQYANSPLIKKLRLEQDERRVFLASNLDPYTNKIASKIALPCYEGTRKRVLNHIMSWIHDISPTVLPPSRIKVPFWLTGAHQGHSPSIPPHNFLWFTGEKSCGKSAVAASIAEYCMLRNILGAIIWIEPCDNPDSYFPTIALQIAQLFREASPGQNVIHQHLFDVLNDDPNLVHHLSARQADKFFVETVKKASAFMAGEPLVIIIEGLDKVNRDRLQETVAIFTSLFEEFSSCSNAKIMICSGSNIAAPISKHVRHLVLERTEPYEDVSLLLESHLAQNDLWSMIGDSRLGLVANQGSHDIFKVFTAIDILDRYIANYGRSKEQSFRLLEVLGIDVDTAEFKFEDAERRQRFEITCSLSTIFKDDQHFRFLLNSNEQDTQVILDACHLLLELSPELSSETEGEITIAMFRLSAKTGLYPQCLMLSPGYLEHKLEKSPEPVNSGAFGDIYKVSVGGAVLCLKMTRANKELVAQMAKTFRQEGIIWSRLAHPNILPFYGLCVFNSRITLVAPWAENGNIRDFLKRQKSDYPNRILLANILVDSSGRACVADFGLSNVNNSQIPHWTSQSSVASKGGTSRYQAPELHIIESDDDTSYGRMALHNTKETDVYAWGGLCYEILTDTVPFHEMPNEYAVVLRIRAGKTPSRPDKSLRAWTMNGLTDEIWDMMIQCWALESLNRPTMGHISAQLDRLKLGDSRSAPEWPPGNATDFRRSHRDLFLSHGSRYPLDVLMEVIEGKFGKFVQQITDDS
ncbi:hypothetical protein DXG01_009095 [Tephrocybe rancida]|nr:hypothetical protein DXG01_009095 [Tephrocybe rancida]